MVTTFSVPAFYLLARALNRQRWLLFAVAGVALGLCLYTYAAGYLLPFVVVLYLGWRWATHPQALKTEWQRVSVYVAGAALVYAPHLVFFIQQESVMSI